MLINNNKKTHNPNFNEVNLNLPTNIGFLLLCLYFLIKVVIHAIREIINKGININDMIPSHLYIFFLVSYYCIFNLYLLLLCIPNIPNFKHSPYKQTQ